MQPAQRASHDWRAHSSRRQLRAQRANNENRWCGCRCAFALPSYHLCVRSKNLWQQQQLLEANVASISVELQQCRQVAATSATQLQAIIDEKSAMIATLLKTKGSSKGKA